MDILPLSSVSFWWALSDCNLTSEICLSVNMMCLCVQLEQKEILFLCRTMNQVDINMLRFRLCPICGCWWDGLGKETILLVFCIKQPEHV